MWNASFSLTREEFYSVQNVYLPVFCFEGLISEFPKFTYPFPSLRASFSSQVKKCLKPVLFPAGAVFQSGKNTILIHFLNFFACKNSTIQHTFSTHHTQYTTTHSIQDPLYISTAHHITSHDITGHHTTWIGAQHLYQVKRMIEGIGNVPCSTYCQTQNG